MKRKINGFRAKLVIFLGLAASLPLLVENYSITKKLQGSNVTVLDGDTIIVQNQKVRLYGIDAPELDQRSFDGLAIGLLSQKYLESLIKGKVVRVEYETRGYYGRIIGRVYTDIDVNKEMLTSGMAVLSRYTKRQDFYLLSYLARLKRRGIYKTSGLLSPAKFRQKKRRD